MEALLYTSEPNDGCDTAKASPAASPVTSGTASDVLTPSPNTGSHTTTRWGRVKRWVARATPWLALVMATLTFAAVGPTFKVLLQWGVPPVRAAAWRAQAQLVFVLPFSVAEFVRTPRHKRYEILKKPNMMAVLANGLAWGTELSIWVIALVYTTSVRASLFASLHPFMLMAYLRLCGHKLSFGEGMGCVVALLGLLISCAEAFTGFLRAKQHLIGDALCLLVSALQVVEVVSSRGARQHVRLFTYSGAITVIFTITVTLWSLIIEQGDATSGPTNSIVGWTSPKYVGTVIFFGLFIGLLGIVSFYQAVKHINPLICTLIGLMQPGLAGALGYALGTDDLPSLYTVIGGLVLVVATAMVAYFDDKRARQAAASKTGEVDGKVEMTGGGVIDGLAAVMTPALLIPIGGEEGKEEEDAGEEGRKAGMVMIEIALTSDESSEGAAEV